jgi:hypothetical protein
VREIRTLRAMRRGLETAYGAATEALPKETGSQRLGRPYGAKRQSSTLPGNLRIKGIWSGLKDDFPHPHKQDIGAANRRSPKGTAFPSS